MPRKYVRRGYKAEDRSKPDLGTPELRLKRLAALGPQRKGYPPIEVALPYAESPLGLLLMQGYLHPQYDQAKHMYDAGVMFAGWFITVYPKLHAQGTLGQFAGDDTDPTARLLTPDEKDRIKAEAERLLADASEYLKKERAVYDAVVNTCVYQRLNHDKLAKLRTGLCRLMEWQRAQREAA